MRAFLLSLFAAAFLLTLASCTDEVGENLTDDLDPTDTLTYTADIQPILETNCTSCHNAQLSNGGVRLHTYAEVLDNVNDSSLVYSIRWENEGRISGMPQSGKMAQSVIDQIELWIQQGAQE